MELKNKTVVVVGMGRTAVALCRLLRHLGAQPFVSEVSDSSALDPLKTQLETLGVAYECGTHSHDKFQKADLIVPSPGVSPQIPPIRTATARGIPVMSELELAGRFCRSKVLAVTGTNGKTTTTELLKTLVLACGKTVLLAGNNEKPLSEAVLEVPQPEYMVLEVSSYQLELATTFRPWIGCVLNVTPDHLARHGSLQEYANCKARMFQAQGTGDVAVLNADDPWVRNMNPPAKVRRLYFSVSTPTAAGLWVDGDVIRDGQNEIATVADNPLPGRHNLENVLAALTMARAAGLPWDLVMKGLHGFKGVEHRIEFVLEHRNIKYYNDSKSTNIDSLRVALESFNQPIILIAGGRGKGADYRVLRELVARHVRALVVIGEDALLLRQAFGDLVPCHDATTLDDAVTRASCLASPGDVVLLSPACASFDMFDNFEHRGRVFKEAVRQYVQKES